jgi:outer membrane protein assembly factor BamB
MSAAASVPLFTSHNAGGAWVANGMQLDKIIDNGTASPPYVWEYTTTKKITGGPVAMGNGKGPVYFGRTDGNYYAVDDATGLILNGNWPITTSGGAACSPWVDVFTWKVLFGSVDGKLDAIPIDY